MQTLVHLCYRRVWVGSRQGRWMPTCSRRYATKLTQLVRVPGMDDAAEIDGQPVYLYKKAFFLIHALRTRVLGPLADASEVGKQLAAHWKDTRLPLPMFVDNVLPTLLLHYGVLDPTGSIIEALHGWKSETSDEKGGVQLGKDDAYRLRAATLAAGAELVARAHTKTEVPHLATLTEAELGTSIPLTRRVPMVGGQERRVTPHPTHPRAGYDHVLVWPRGGAPPGGTMWSSHVARAWTNLALSACMSWTCPW